MQTTVVNVKSATADIYIGRRQSGMHYGNPFSHLDYGLAQIKVPTREDSINEFRRWLNGDAWFEVEPERRHWILTHIDELKGKRLGCYCKPLSCHGDILAAYADA